jgi:hypothetical protein
VNREGEKEWEQGGKRTSADVLGWGGSEAGVPGTFFGNDSYTQQQEGYEACSGGCGK